MPEVINVRFRNRGKVYFFDPAGNDPKQGEQVVVETAKGLEIGDCVQSVHMVDESSIVAPLRPVIRVATEEDIKISEDNREKEKAAFVICQEKIASHGLDMKLVDVEYSFEGNKILFFFTSDGRVDFRELVKDLASVFRTRIELRQIGVRDGAKMLGGLGICGRSLCCNTFLDDFQPVSIKMAKTQSLSLNPTKISGVCGRLMCCLKYEQDAYEYLIKTVPKVDTTVMTPQGKGTVIDVNLLRRTVKVKLEDSDALPQSYNVDRLGYFIGGEYKQPEPEKQEDPPPEEAAEDIVPGEPEAADDTRKYKSRSVPPQSQIKEEAEDGADIAVDKEGNGNAPTKVHFKKHKKGRRPNDRYNKNKPKS